MIKEAYEAGSLKCAQQFFTPEEIAGHSAEIRNEGDAENRIRPQFTDDQLRTWLNRAALEGKAENLSEAAEWSDKPAPSVLRKGVEHMLGGGALGALGAIPLSFLPGLNKMQGKTIGAGAGIGALAAPAIAAYQGELNPKKISERHEQNRKRQMQFYTDPETHKYTATKSLHRQQPTQFYGEKRYD